MRNRVTDPTRLAVLLLLLIGLAPAAARVEAQEKKPLTLEDYARWSEVGEVAVSPDGSWMTFTYESNEGDATFHVRRLGSEGEPRTFTNGADPEFSADSRWLAFTVSPPEAEAEKLRSQRKPVPQSLRLVELGASSGEEPLEIADVASFAFSEDGRFLAVKKDRADSGGSGGEASARRPGGSGGGGNGDDSGPRGSDLLVRVMGSGATVTLGNVTSYAFNEPSTHLAYLVDAEGREGNGVYLLELATGRMAGLETGPDRFDGLAWSEDGTRLAALRGKKPDGVELRENVMLAFAGVGAGGAAAAEGDGGAWLDGVERIVYDPAGDPGFPEGLVLTEHREPEWSRDGRRVLVGIKEQRPELDDDKEVAADVEVWHWKDDEIQSRQRVTSRQDARDSWEAVFNLDGRRLVRLADPEMDRVFFTDHPRFVIGASDVAYEMIRDRPRGRTDYFRVDLDSGEREPMVDGVVNELGTSPDGRWMVFLRDEHVVARELESGREVDLSARAGADFVDREHDRPGEKPSHGMAGWSEDGQRVVLNAEHDVWAVPLDGGEAVNLTGGMGAREGIRFRVVNLDEEDGGGGFAFFSRGLREADELDLDGPLLLSAFGVRSKKSGYFRTRQGEEPEPLLWGDEMIGSGGFRSPGIRKAADSDRVVFTRQTFERFPDWWVSDLSFENSERVTEANPQQDEFLWGERVLVDYVDDRGHELQATLALPAGYEEGRRYPMLVYFYEKLSDRHHQYSMPTYDDRPHMSTYASNGYLVLMPDIVYDEGRPGTSALDDVTAATEKVIELGYADPERIGIQGHSWGGYESSFILTQTDMFAAVVTGAPLTNMVSMYLVNYKRTGNANQGLIEWGQGRMGVSPWDDMALYHEQSPLHHAPNISTPFLILHGTDDGAVDWNQGLEFYNAARRLGKEVILLSYPGEPHHLEVEDNQKDFQIRMKQFFDHHLKGEPAPLWMREGVDWLDRKRVQPTAR